MIKLSAKPMITGTRNARIGSTALGMTRNAGRKVSITSRAATMPVAATGPVERLEFNSLSNRHIRPIEVVAADAMIGGATLRQARRMASNCVGKLCSSSRYLLMSRSE
jgi:hypothetical protein